MTTRIYKEDIISSGQADFIGAARAFIADPEWGIKAYEGRSEDVVPCLRCNKCHIPGPEKWNTVCSVNPVWGIEHKAERMVAPKPGTPKKLAVVGGGEIGVEMGLHLAARGHAVTVLEMQGVLSPESVPVHFRSLLQARWENEPNFSYVLNARVTAIEDGRIVYERGGETAALSCGSVVLAAGMKPRSDEAMAFFTGNVRVHIIGDCDRVGSIQSAMRAAYALASNL